MKRLVLIAGLATLYLAIMGQLLWYAASFTAERERQMAYEKLLDVIEGEQE